MTPSMWVEQDRSWWSCVPGSRERESGLQSCLARSLYQTCLLPRGSGQPPLHVLKVYASPTALPGVAPTVFYTTVSLIFPPRRSNCKCSLVTFFTENSITHVTLEARIHQEKGRGRVQMTEKWRSLAHWCLVLLTNELPPADDFEKSSIPCGRSSVEQSGVRSNTFLGGNQENRRCELFQGHPCQ